MCFIILTWELGRICFFALVSLPIKMVVLAGQREYLLVHAAPVELYEEGHWKDEREYAVWKRIPMTSSQLFPDRTEYYSIEGVVTGREATDWKRRFFDPGTEEWKGV